MPAKADLVHGYAQALFTVAEAEGALDAVEDELFAFAKAVEQHAELRQALTDPALPAENRTGVIQDLLGERANPLTASLLRFLVESGHAREIGVVAEELARVAAERRQHQMAEVRTALPLTADQREKIAAALSKATGRRIEVKGVVDPSVVGGVVARVGDEVFDGSVATRLADAKQQLTS